MESLAVKDVMMMKLVEMSDLATRMIVRMGVVFEPPRAPSFSLTEMELVLPK